MRESLLQFELGFSGEGGDVSATKNGDFELT